MGSLSASASSLLPAGNTGTSGVCLQTDLQGGHRGMLCNTLPRSVVLGSQAGLSGEASDPRPVVPQQVCQVRQIQNDYSGASADPSSPWGFHSFARSVRRFLAHPNCSPVLSLSSVCSWPQTVSLPDDAVRPQLRPRASSRSWSTVLPRSYNFGGFVWWLTWMIGWFGHPLRSSARRHWTML